MEASDLLKESIKVNSMKGELVFDPGEAGSLGGGTFCSCAAVKMKRLRTPRHHPSPPPTRSDTPPSPSPLCKKQ